MFFCKRFVLLAACLLLVSGCTGRLIREDPSCDVVPRGTAEMVQRAFHPDMLPFIHEIRFSTFDASNVTYRGSYCPGIGVEIATSCVGRMEFNHMLPHEVLHAIYTNGLHDQDVFDRVLERLLSDPRLRGEPAYEEFIKPIEGNSLWPSIVYTFTERNERFARIGDEIVRRGGADVPEYLWEAYRGILHPWLEYNSRQYSKPPLPKEAEFRFEDGTTARQYLLSTFWRMPYSSDRVAPRHSGIREVQVDLDVPYDSQGRPLLLQFMRRSRPELMAQCAVTAVTTPEGLRWRCVWTAAEGQAIANAWREFDLDIRPFDPTIALVR